MLYWKQESILYIPQLDSRIPRSNKSNPRGYQSPVDYGFRKDETYDENWIKTEDGVKIHSWLLYHGNDSFDKVTLVFFHGNAGNIGFRLPNAKEMYKKLDCNILLVEYRGYGDSDDISPTEAGLKLDSEAAVEFIQKHPKIDPTKIILFGRSLGGAVAFHVAKSWDQNNKKNEERQPLAGIIVENTFCSIDEMVDIIFPFLKPVKGPLLRMHWNSKEISRTLSSLSILYLAGEKDEIVPHSQMQDLYRLSSSNNKNSFFHVVPTGQHNDTWLQGGSQYWKAIKTYIQTAIKNNSTS